MPRKGLERQRAKPAAPASAQPPDVQARKSPRPFALTRVGVRGVRKPVTVHRPGMKPHGVVASFDLFVDLPKTQKGTHMSRNLEALADILDEEIAGEAPSLENLCRRIARRLLDKHEYASRADVAASADFFLRRRNPGGKASVEAYRIHATAACSRAGPDERTIGVEVTGMSACPCAMETVRHHLTAQGKQVPLDVPVITHNQRNRVHVRLGLPGDLDVEAADLVDLCEDALSAPTFELLKRGDEGDLVLQAHQQPRFVEDVVREALHLAAQRFGKHGDLPVFVSSEAEESIHKHNAYAERTTTLRAAE